MISTLECIGNTFGGFSIGPAEWEGVRINHLLNEARGDLLALELMLREGSRYSNILPLSSTMKEDVLFATKINEVNLALT